MQAAKDREAAPKLPALAEREHRVVAQFVEKSTTGQSWRITLTAPFINRSRQVMFLVAGQAKAKALKAILEGPHDPERLPAQLIDPAKTRESLALGLSAAANAPVPDARFGVFRM